MALEFSVKLGSPPFQKDPFRCGTSNSLTTCNQETCPSRLLVATVLCIGGIVRFIMSVLGLTTLTLGLMTVPVQTAQGSATIAASARAFGDTELRAALLEAEPGEVISLIVPTDAVAPLGAMGFEAGAREPSYAPFRHDLQPVNR